MHGERFRPANRRMSDIIADLTALHAFHVPRPASLTLDRLYDELQLSRLGDRSDSDRPALRSRRTIARSSDSAPAALAFGRVASVLQSIERLLAVHGPTPAGLRAAVRSASATRPALARSRAPLDRAAPDLVALLWILQQMLDEAGSIEAFFARGLRPGGGGHRRRARQLLDARAGARPRRPRTAGSCRYGPASVISFPRPSAGSACKRLNLFLRWMVRRDALDLGVWTRVTPARLVVPLDTHVIRVGRCLRLTRYTSPGWRDGARHHRVAARARSGRSGEVRLLAVPPRHDERLRLQSRAGRRAVSAARRLPATRAYTAAVSATIRSTVNRSRTRAQPGLAHPAPQRSSSGAVARSRSPAPAASRGGTSSPVPPSSTISGMPPARVATIGARARHRVEQRRAEAFGDRAHRRRGRRP